MEQQGRCPTSHEESTLHVTGFLIVIKLLKIGYDFKAYIWGGLVSYFERYVIFFNYIVFVETSSKLLLCRSCRVF